MRRATFRDQTVDYAAVGASQAPDLLQYPPDGSIAAVDSWRIGSGEERFRKASEDLLSWRVVSGAGLEITDVRPPRDAAYTGVSFAADGTPKAPASRDEEPRTNDDGLMYVTPGATAHLTNPRRGQRANADYRVIFVAEDSRRTAFAIGTVDATIVSGEILLAVEWRDNDEVWFEVRAFDVPVAWPYKLFKGFVRRRRKRVNSSYLRAISPLFA